MFDKFKDECGVFGVYGHSEASKLEVYDARIHRPHEAPQLGIAGPVIVYTESGLSYPPIISVGSYPSFRIAAMSCAGVAMAGS